MYKDLKGEEIRVNDRILHATTQGRSPKLVEKIVTGFTKTGISATAVDPDHGWSGGPTERGKSTIPGHGTESKIYILERDWALPALVCRLCGFPGHDTKYQGACNRIREKLGLPTAS